ncbi:MAG: prenyltransferase, partial [Thermoplasmatota archaeon]
AVLAVQGGANALHHLRTRRPRGPLAPPEPPGVWFRILMTTGYLVGTGLGVWLALETPALLGVGAAGLGLSFLYSRLRARGLGPLVAALTYGPLITVGALHAMVGYQDGALHGTALAASLPLAVFAAALFYVNDLADRGLDEATGKRTLLVRLPRADHAAGFAVLVTAGAATALGLLAWLGARGIAWLLLLGVSVAAGWLIVAVRRHVDDPAGLAAARFGTLALHAATGALLLAATYLEAA